MEKIKNIDQFRTSLNETLQPFFARKPGNDSETGMHESVTRIRDSFVSLAEDVFLVVPDTSIREVALTGLLGNAYVIAAASAGVWSSKVAA
jgi:hypothetical protein